MPGLSAIATFLTSKIGIAVILILLALGGLWYVNDTAYERGASEVRAEMQEIIADMKKAVDRDEAETEGMTPDELNEWFKRKCLEAGGKPEQCG